MKNLEDRLIKYRRFFHKHPQLSDKEYHTQQKIFKFFKDKDCQIRKIKTGLIVYFHNDKETTIAYRCELDALNIKEANDVSYKSVNNYMHACGHDGHIAILLLLGEYINKNIKLLKHNYMLIFEHAEETYGGAKDIIQDEFYLSHVPKYVFALHLYPGLNQGEIYSKSGYFLSRPVEIDIRISGKASHVALKEEGIDSLNEGVLFINRLNKILKRYKNVKYLFGEFKSGKQRNVVSDETIIKGTIRVLNDKTIASIKKVINEESLLFKNVDVTFKDDFCSLYNDPTLLIKIKKIYDVKDTSIKYISDSFAFYKNKSKICYALLGVNSSPLHSNIFNFDENVLTRGYNYFLSLLNIE